MPPKKMAAPTKSQVQATIAEKTGLTKAQVASVLNSLEEVMVASLKTHKVFTVNGILKVKSTNTPAKPAREGRRPGTNEMMMFKAKPASRRISATVLKRLKDQLL